MSNLGEIYGELKKQFLRALQPEQSAWFGYVPEYEIVDNKSNIFSAQNPPPPSRRVECEIIEPWITTTGTTTTSM